MKLTPNALRRRATPFANVTYCPGDKGYCAPRGAEWRYEAEYDVEKLIPLMPSGWTAWFERELLLYPEPSSGRHYARLLEEDIEEPIIVLEREGLSYIWEGWHRTGAAVKKGQTKIRAIVGTPWRGE